MPGFTWVKFDQNFETSYTIKKEGNGVYTFVLKGDFTLGGINVNERDGLKLLMLLHLISKQFLIMLKFFDGSTHAIIIKYNN
jgi:hypothetical protein